MMIFYYHSKMDLKEAIGLPLQYEETSMFSPEYKDNGKLVGSNRPSITGCGKREFFAEVEMKDGKIFKVT